MGRKCPSHTLTHLFEELRIHTQSHSERQGFIKKRGLSPISSNRYLALGGQDQGDPELAGEAQHRPAQGMAERRGEEDPFGVKCL